MHFYNYHHQQMQAKRMPWIVERERAICQKKWHAKKLQLHHWCWWWKTRWKLPSHCRFIVVVAARAVANVARGTAGAWNWVWDIHGARHSSGRHHPKPWMWWWAPLHCLQHRDSKAGWQVREIGTTSLGSHKCWPCFPRRTEIARVPPEYNHAASQASIQWKYSRSQEGFWDFCTSEGEKATPFCGFQTTPCHTAPEGGSQGCRMCIEDYEPFCCGGHEEIKCVPKLYCGEPSLTHPCNTYCWRK